MPSLRIALRFLIYETNVIATRPQGLAAVNCCRVGRTRTDGLLYPKQALWLLELLPEINKNPATKWCRVRGSDEDGT